MLTQTEYKKEYLNLGKTSLSKAQRLVSYLKNSNNNHHNNTVEYGSILAFEEDFVRLI
jgi:hypothetical protein